MEVLDVLVEAGADLNALDSRGWGAAHYAAQFGQEAFLARLIAAGMDVSRPNVHRATPLVRGCGAATRLGAASQTPPAILPP